MSIKRLLWKLILKHSKVIEIIKCFEDLERLVWGHACFRTPPDDPKHKIAGERWETFYKIRDKFNKVIRG